MQTIFTTKRLAIGLLLALGISYALIPNSALCFMGVYLGLELLAYVLGHKIAGWAWTLRPVAGLTAIAAIGIKYPEHMAYYWDCAVVLMAIYIPTLFAGALALDWFNERWDWVVNQKGVSTKPQSQARQ